MDQELSAKIESELQMEKDIRDSEQYPATVQEYLDNSPFEVRFSSHGPNLDTKSHRYTIHPAKKKL